MKSMTGLPRRRFLQVLGGTLAGLSAPSLLRQKAFDAIGAAHALPANTPSYFIEINLRDQDIDQQSRPRPGRKQPVHRGHLRH